MTPAEIIAQAKQNKFLGQGDVAVRAFMNARISELSEKALAAAMPKIIADAKEQVAAEIDRLTKDVQKGDKGDQGAIGPRGERGLTGDKGDTGERGPQGYAGMDGQEGLPGPQGGVGPAGKDGSPDTGDEIAKKLNTTTESVDFTVIRGLKNWMGNLQRSIKDIHGGGKAGGGMGNWIHESINVDQNTTFVRTSTAIAADGFAVFAFYQGGMIARGSAYTVSGRQQLDLLFVPQPGTIDIIFVRT